MGGKGQRLGLICGLRHVCGAHLHGRSCSEARPAKWGKGNVKRLCLCLCWLSKKDVLFVYCTVLYFFFLFICAVITQYAVLTVRTVATLKHNMMRCNWNANGRSTENYLYLYLYLALRIRSLSPPLGYVSRTLAVWEHEREGGGRNCRIATRYVLADRYGSYRTCMEYEIWNMECFTTQIPMPCRFPTSN